MYTLRIVAPTSADDGGLDRPALGARDALVKRLSDLLPGLEFDDRGRGEYRRGPYQLAFTMPGKEPTSIAVAIDQAEGFTVMMRIAEKTGWSVLDPETNDPVDLEASRSTGRLVHVGEMAKVVLAPAQAPKYGTRRWSLRTPLLAAVSAGAVVIALSVLWPANPLALRLPSSIISNRQSAARFERYADRVRRRAAAVKTLSPEFKVNPIVEQMVDVQMASRAYWNFVDGRYSSPELLSDSAVWSRFLLPSFLPDTFAKAQRDGYTFEFRGEGCEEAEPGWPECAGYSYVARPADDEHGTTFALFSADDRIHFRTDGRIPRREDPTIDRKQ